MKAVFIGSVEFSFRSLEKLIAMGVDLVGVCAKKSSAYNSDFFDLKPLCNKNKIPCFYTEDINSITTVQWIKNLNPDIIFCFEFCLISRPTFIWLFWPLL